MNPFIHNSPIISFIRLLVEISDKFKDDSFSNDKPDERKKYDSSFDKGVKPYIPPEDKKPDKIPKFDPLTTLRNTVSKVKDKYYDHIDKNKTKTVDYDDHISEIEKKVEPHKKKLPNVKGLFGNVTATTRNLVTNAVDNTLGYAIAKGQNYKTKKALKNGDSEKDIVYLMHGLYQNEGSQWRLGSQLKKEGKHVYHLKGNHGTGRNIDRSVEKAYNQIDKLHKGRISKEDAISRNDYFSGHSSGGDVGIHLGSDAKTRDYGIKRVQARAPMPYGFRPSTIAQKLLGSIANLKGDNLKYKDARKRASDFSRKDSVMPVHVLSGEYDKLVIPKDAHYIKATDHKVLKGKNSSHFGTSGVNVYSNKVFVDEIMDHYKKDNLNDKYGFDKV